MSRPTLLSISSVIVLIIGLVSIEAAQNLRELARHQAVHNPGVPLEQPAPPGDYWPKAIRELTREADVVLVAALSRQKSYLNASEDRILTDYAVVGANVIAGKLPVASASVPGTVPPLILTVYGGEVMIEGVLVRGTDNNREPIKDGELYVLFLRESRREQPGQYEIYYGGIFEISEDRVVPLLKRAETVFKGTVDQNPEDFISRVRNAGSPR